jgi:hypothetical protein
MFYNMRAYAKIRDSEKWRYISVYALTILFGFSITVIIYPFVPIENIIYFENKDATFYLTALPLAVIPLSIGISTDTVIRERYGYLKIK